MARSAQEDSMGKWPILDKLDMIDSPIDDDNYERRLKKLQRQLLDLQVYHIRTGGRVLIALDGWDAAGKGGMIQRIVYGVEPRPRHVWRLAPPTPDNQAPPSLSPSSQ